jgi:DNA-directed RNA polymerase subunit beta
MPTNPSQLTRIFSSPEEIARNVDAVLSAGLERQFPVESRNYRVEVSNVRAEPKPFTNDDEKDAILRSKSLTYPIKADVKLIDKNTGNVVDESKGYTLMDTFHLTGKHTMVYKGNNYSVANQLQLRPGVYTRSKDTGELESHFNTGTGRSFSLTLDPQSGLFYVNIGSSNVLAAPLLTHVFGIGPREVGSYIPPQVWDDNLKAMQGKDGKILGDLYKRLVSTSKQKAGASLEEMAAQLKLSLESSQLSEQTTKATLGKALTGVNHDSILLAMRNLTEVHSGRRPEDNRDSLQFKRVQNLPDFLTTRFDKEHQIVKSVKGKIMRDMERMDKSAPSVRSALSSKPFNKFFSNYIVSSNLASTPSETNPIESLENVAKVTVLGAGEGGIGSERAVPMSARDIDPSHLGIIDPSRTPESSHAGIDQRFTISSRRDKDGNLFARVVDNQNKVHYLSVAEMMSHTIGFPHQDPKAKKVQAQVNGELKEVDRSQVDYWLGDGTDMYTITTNLVPFLNSNHPGRLTMAGKAIPQALSLVDREAPLVQTTNANGSSILRGVATVVGTKSLVDGVVKSVTDRQVVIQDKDGATHKVPSVKNLPFNMKGFLDDEKPIVKEGDKVSAGDVLYENNYTKDGVLALGKNLNVAYIPYKGYNHEDGLVISRSAAAGLSSHHAYKIDYSVQESSVMKKSLIARYFPGRFTKEQLDKLDDKGFAKVGTTLHHGDPAYIVLERREPTPEDRALGRLHKTLVTPFKAVTEMWTHEEDGSVVDAHTDGKELRLIVRSKKPLEVGDKLTGLHGNKGIVSLILEDHEMPFIKETGKPVDLLLNPASVTSRVNLGQLMETAAGKIAQKTGKPYLVHNFTKGSNVVELNDELKKHGIPDAEVMVDPKTGKDLGKILTGPQYMLKLYKTSDQNWSARNVGGYDNTMQPTKGGEEGSKSVGWMEALGLMGSDARKNLKEISTLKSEENQEYWNKFLTGQPLPKPKTTFATQKFLHYLTGAGIKTSIKDGKITASPMTDQDILSMSHGQIIEPTMLAAKDLAPEKGGLFDQSKTGGIRGNRWTHYQLAEAIPHPLMERPIKSILGLSTKEFDAIAHGSLGLKHEGKGVFHLHDVATGKHIKTLNVNTAKPIEEDEPEVVEHEDDTP